jgi:hypothetical protein
MTKTYNFNSRADFNISAPVWCDYDQNSEYSKKLIKTKQDNDHSFWDNMRDVLAYDYKNLPIERVKVWASVMSVPLMSNTRHSSYIRDALNALDYGEEALIEPMIGLNQNDYQMYYKVFDDFTTTMNRIQHLGHLIKCGITPDKLKDMETITEIGGGLGEMTDIIYKLGFKGKYMIYDFPELSAIQSSFHNQLGLKDIVYTSDMEDLVKSDLVIGTWSITEAPIDIRNNIIERLKDSQEWLLAYSNNIFGLDNDEWINDSFLPMMDGDIEIKNIPEMSWDNGTYYCHVKSY